MTNPLFNNEESSNILKQAVTDIIKTAAQEEKVLSNLLKLENELIQRAKTESINLEEFVSINDSVNSVIRNIAKLQLMAQVKLEYLEELLQKMADFDEKDAPEERVGDYVG